MIKNKNGFTLGEVLVALGVLGVLVLILLPLIQNATPDKNKVMFKKAYSTLEDSISTLANDEANYPSNQVGSIRDIDGVTFYNGPIGFNYQTKTDAVPATDNKFCYLLSQALDVVGNVDCGTGTTYPSFSTSDGILWTLYLPSGGFPNLFDSDYYGATVTFDVNGADKLPNCADSINFSNPTVTKCSDTTIVPDIYQVGIRFDGKLTVPSTELYANVALASPQNNRKCNPNVAGDCK